jgi:hypothetical protein
MRCILLAMLLLGSFCGHALAWRAHRKPLVCDTSPKAEAGSAARMASLDLARGRTGDEDRI